MWLPTSGYRTTCKRFIRHSSVRCLTNITGIKTGIKSIKETSGLWPGSRAWNASQGRAHHS